MAEKVTDVRQLIDDVLRGHLATVSEGEGPDRALLGSWVLVTDWIDAEDGEHWYFRLSSDGIPPHSRMGLLHIGLELEE